MGYFREFYDKAVSDQCISHTISGTSDKAEIMLVKAKIWKQRKPKPELPCSHRYLGVINAAVAAL
jgi:hypothetical protein